MDNPLSFHLTSLKEPSRYGGEGLAVLCHGTPGRPAAAPVSHPSPRWGVLPVASAAQGVHSRRCCGTIAFEFPRRHHIPFAILLIKGRPCVFRSVPFFRLAICRQIAWLSATGPRRRKPSVSISLKCLITCWGPTEPPCLT